MRKYLIWCMVALSIGCVWVTLSYSQVSKIFGLGANGPVVFFPTQVEIMCDGTGGNLNCPQYFSPDFTDETAQRFFGVTNLTNPARCVLSTDGGSGWSPCATNPFSVATTGTIGTAFAMNFDGHLLAAGDVDHVANACVIRRSIDGGVSWTTVFTMSIADGFCGAYSTTAMPSPMKCARDTDVCVLLGTTAAGTTVKPIISLDNGNSWAFGLTLTTSSGAPPYIGVSLNAPGLLGVSGGSSVQPGVSRMVETNGGLVWTQTGLPGTLPGASHRCTAPIQDNLATSPEILCTPSSLATTTYYFMNINATIPTIIRSFTLSDGLAFANAPDLIAVQWDSNTYYMVQRSLSTLQTNIWITRDSFASTFLLKQILPSNPFPACCRGDMYKYAGGIYFSSGGVGGSAQLYRIF